MVTAKKGKEKNKGKNGSLKENNELSAGSRRTVLLYYHSQALETRQALLFIETLHNLYYSFTVVPYRSISWVKLMRYVHVVFGVYLISVFCLNHVINDHSII